MRTLFHALLLLAAGTTLHLATSEEGRERLHETEFDELLRLGDELLPRAASVH